MFFRRRSNDFNLNKTIEGCIKRRALDQKALFDAYGNFAKNICLRYAANEDEAEEMVSDGFLKVFNNIEKYDPKQAFDAWFRTIMVNTAIDYFRRYHSKIDFTDLDSAREIKDNEDEIDLLSTDEILAFVQRLSPVYRTVFSLYVVEGFSYAEIAEKVGVTEGAVRSNVSKARAKLQEWISDYVVRQSKI